MAEKSFSVLDLLDFDLKGHNSLNLRCLCGRGGLGREITLPDLNRPGLALSGFYDSFGFQRVQVFGRGETAYLEKFVADGNLDTVKRLVSYHIHIIFRVAFLRTRSYRPIFLRKLPKVRAVPFCKPIWNQPIFRGGCCVYFPIFLHSAKVFTGYCWKYTASVLLYSAIREWEKAKPHSN